MRVLHVYAGNLYGGVERLLAEVAVKRAAAPGMETHFALCFGGRLGNELRAAGATVHPLGPVRLSRPWTVLRARRRLAAVLDGGFDAVVCHSTWSHGLFSPAARRRAKVVFWIHDVVTGRTWADRLARRTRPAGVLAASRVAAAAVGRLWSPEPACTVVHPPVSPPAAPGRADVRAELDTPAGDVVILQASRMEPWKGHAPHVEALGRLRDVAGWTCWMAGGAVRPHERTHRDSLVRRAAELGVADRVRFLGHRDDVPRLMAAADVFCQPNLGPEPFGIVFVEALYAGLPVVASDTGSAEEVLGADGVRVPPGDVDALAAALRGLLADAGARAALSARGPARARALCEPARQVRAMEAALRQVVTGREMDA